MNHNSILPIILFLSLLKVSSLFAQDTTIVIEYDRTSNWVKINNTLPYLSKEEKERMNFAYGKRDGWVEKYVLQIKGQQSYYDVDENYENDKYEWSNRKDVYKIYRNYAENTQKCLIESLGKTYFLDSEIVSPKWKILTEIKEVGGLLCMKAETYDTTKNQKIYAWFTDQLPAVAGPELFTGLPGTILEIDINDGATVISASKIDQKFKLEKLSLPKKWKGKKVTPVEYNAIVDKYVKECIAANRNPYWAIRY